MTLLSTFADLSFKNSVFLNAKTNKYLPNVSKDAVIDRLQYTTRLSDDVKKCLFWTG